MPDFLRSDGRCCLWLMALVGLVLVLGLQHGSAAHLKASAQTAPALSPAAYLPLVSQLYRCPSTHGASYASGPAFQYDLDNPVRPAALHADKNIELRGYQLNDEPSVRHDLVNYGNNDPVGPPQFATLFAPARTPTMPAVYRVYDWQWAPSPDPGRRGDLQTRYPATAAALETRPGELLRVPTSGYDIGGGHEALVLYADADTVALRYTREDSSGAPGYTVHIDNICTNTKLLALYRKLDRPDGPRYVYVPPSSRPYAYDLPALPAGHPIGQARDGFVVVAVTDSGAFQDPRSCNDWWQVRPGYGADCRRD